MPESSHAFDPDLLVAWLAEVGSGQIDRLRKDVAWAARADTYSATRWIGLMEDLGFLRVSWLSRTWVVEPQRFTFLPGTVRVALLVGARPAPDYWKGLPGAVVYQNQPQEGCIQPPSTVWFQDHEEQASAVLGAPLTACAAEQIAGALPKLELPPPGHRPSRQTELALFDGSSGRFKPSGSAGSPREGLYRYFLYGRIPHYAIFRDHHWHGVDRDEGIHLVLPPTTFPFLWKADGDNQHGLGRLTVNNRAPLPHRQRKAAVLCTGLPPLRSADGHVYDGVPRPVAEQIAESLHRKLEIQ
ncbi:hypothetical protein [Nonomuraea harbinensis]|uniref:Uncharacterized protein n=1 Tax=Nonomuraea harbinensis TaxID=1286938 RepID=A0ABW1C7Y5_9ACTN|nr:hypothetical protein [Nonomuraea harbinensis]